MKSKFLVVLAFVFLTAVPAFAAMPFVGMYQTIDDETNLPKSIVALYEYNNGDESGLAGRIVALYGADGQISETLSNPTRIADAVDGTPKYVGLDIIWDMAWDANDAEYTGGKIMDPAKGKVYSSVMWQEDKSKLQVRGKIGPFGRTQVWNVLNVSDLPTDLQNVDTSAWKPVVRK